MYERFFALSTNPFSLTPNPAFLYLTQEHRDAIAGLMYGILSRKGIMVLSGDAGTGKTTLLHSLMKAIPADRAEFSFVLNPGFSVDEFFRSALASFRVDATPTRKDEILSSLQKHLLVAHQKNISVVLVIDEAHRLSPELLEEIRLLANFETETDKLLQILLVGQDELDSVLDRHDLRQLKQRIAIRLRIQRLSTEQVAEYVQHRWTKATSRPLPFDADALSAIGEYSSGTPRLVNSLCDNALIHAFAQGASTVSKAVILDVAQDLHMKPAPSSVLAESPSTQAVVVNDIVSPANGSEPFGERTNRTLTTLESYASVKRWPFRWGTRAQGA